MANYEGLSTEQLIAALKAKDEQAKAMATRKLSLKVSEKGAVSLYGMGKFPVTLYGEQWLKVLDHAVVIRQFLDDNASLLKSKDEAKAS